MGPKLSKFFFVSLILVIFSTTSVLAKGVIVQFNEDPAALAAAKAKAAGTPMSADAIQAYRNTLATAHQKFLTALAAKGVSFQVNGISVDSVRIDFAYTLVYNGIALEVDPTAVPAILGMPQVRAVHDDTVMRTLLDRSVPYIRAPEVYGAVKEVTQFDDFREGFEGQGIYLSVIDSGIEWHHEMFGGDHTPPRLGVAPVSANTNKKVVYYLPLGDVVVEDGLGHGTHVAATAAGYRGYSPGDDGLPLTGDDVPMHGVAPQAKIMSYKVCSDVLSSVGAVGGPVGGCVSSAITMAIEDSMSPRTVTGFPKPVAHVINMSLGGSGTPDSVTALAADNAVRLGAVVVAAAGNSGPGESTAGAPCVGRLVTCVANSIDPAGSWSVDVLGADSFPRTRVGAVTPANQFMASPNRPNIQLIPMAGAPAPPLTSVAQYYVFVSGGETPLSYPATVAGRIALVRTSLQATFGQVANSAALAGAVGVIMRTDVANPTAVKTTIPAAVLPVADFDYLVSQIGLGTTPPSGTISNLPLRLNSYYGNTTMNSSSSRGPVAGFGQVKPDVTAPGTNIMAALPPASLLGALAQGNYGSISGTSMASPHVAGAAVLVKQSHPTWGPDMVRTALMNTSTNLRNENGIPKINGVERTVDQGAGLIDVYEAVNIKAVMGVESTDLNKPSILGAHSFGEVPSINAQAVVTRSVSVTIRDVSGAGGTYALSVINNRNLGDGIGASVSPSSVTVPANGSATFTVTASIDGNAITTGAPMQIEWYVSAVSANESLRMPFYLRATQTQPSAAILNPIGDDTTPDVENGVDRDGRYTVSWTYPATELARPCGYRIEEAQSTASGTVWFDDAETAMVNGNAKWTGSDWTSKPHPGTLSLGYSPVYIDARTVSITSVPIDLPFALNTLTFDSYEDIELDFDYGYVDASDNGGASWTTLATYSGAFTGERTVDLSAFAGRQVRLRFRLVADELISTPAYQGWTIDNIRIRAGAAFTTLGTVAAGSTSLAIGGKSDGTYSYRVTALFGNCSSSPFATTPSNIQIISVSVATRPPVAAFTASPNPSYDWEDVTLDASMSRDQDSVNGSSIRQYHWSFGDGTFVTSTTPVITHNFAAPGTYRVSLVVVDDDGESASTEALQTVRDPSASVSGAGYVPSSSNDKSNFSIDTSTAGGTASGAMQWHDHASKLKIASTRITRVERSGNTARVFGECTVNKKTTSPCTMEVTDGGAVDTVTMRVGDNYVASGTVGGGDVIVREQ